MLASDSLELPVDVDFCQRAWRREHHTLLQIEYPLELPALSRNTVIDRTEVVLLQRTHRVYQLLHIHLLIFRFVRLESATLATGLNRVLMCRYNSSTACLIA